MAAVATAGLVWVDCAISGGDRGGSSHGDEHALVYGAGDGDWSS